MNWKFSALIGSLVLGEVRYVMKMTEERREIRFLVVIGLGGYEIVDYDNPCITCNLKTFFRHQCLLKNHACSRIRRGTDTRTCPYWNIDKIVYDVLVGTKWSRAFFSLLQELDPTQYDLCLFNDFCYSSTRLVKNRSNGQNV